MSQSTIPVAAIQVGTRHRKDMGDIAGLAASIRDVGLLQPLVVRPDHTLVCGGRRLEAIKSLGWADVPVVVAENLADLLAALKAERDENFCRKDYTPLELVEVGRDIEEQARKEARERQARAGPATGRGKKASPDSFPMPPPPLSTATGSGNFPEPVNTQARDEVGEALGVSGRTYEKAKAVAEAAEEEPETYGPIAEEMDRTGKVDPAYREVRRIQAQGSAPPELLRVERTAADDLTDLARTVRERLLGTQNRYGDPAAYVPAIPPGIRRTVRTDLANVIQALSAVVEEIDRCQSPKSPSGESTPTS